MELNVEHYALYNGHILFPLPVTLGNRNIHVVIQHIIKFVTILVYLIYQCVASCVGTANQSVFWLQSRGKLS